MKNFSRKEAVSKIEEYFSRSKLDPEKTRKIKKLAMKNRVSLKEYRKKFCKKCYFDLNYGRIRISKEYKYIQCINCKKRNTWKIR